VRYEAPPPEEVAEVGEVVLETGSTHSIDHEASAPRATAFPYTHILCVRFQVDTFDSGFENSAGQTEDVWPNANSGTTETAHGVRVRVGSTTWDTGVNGCRVWTSSVFSTSHNVRVYAYASDANSNFVRVHTGPAYNPPQEDYPGSTYSLLTTNVLFVHNVPTVLNVGSYSPRWTLMGALATSLNRYGDGISDTEFHVADSGDCGWNENYHNDPSENLSYIVMEANSCHGTSQRNKFVVAHEYGHAYLYQVSNMSTQSPASASHNVTPSNCPFSENGLAYTNRTKEWSSLAFREGFAHFISARVWNDSAADGHFRWGQSYDLDRWDSSDAPGGYLVNECCSGTGGSCANSLNGTGVIPDWMRGLWDFHTDSVCPRSKSQMALFHWLVAGQSGLDNDEFFAASQTAASIFGTTCAQRWDLHACHNGLDRVGQSWSGC
jgi:hypothetical protein